MRWYGVVFMFFLLLSCRTTKRTERVESLSVSDDISSASWSNLGQSWTSNVCVLADSVVWVQDSVSTANPTNPKKTTAYNVRIQEQKEVESIISTVDSVRGKKTTDAVHDETSEKKSVKTGPIDVVVIVVIVILVTLWLKRS